MALDNVILDLVSELLGWKSYKAIYTTNVIASLNSVICHKDKIFQPITLLKSHLFSNKKRLRKMDYTHSKREKCNEPDYHKIW